MPFELTGVSQYAGYAVTPKKQGETHVTVRLMDFVMNDDELFIKAAEAFLSGLLSHVSEDLRPHPSTIDNLLGIIRRDGTASLYVNEIVSRALIRPKRDIEGGEKVYTDDIADIAALRLSTGTLSDQGLTYADITLPEDAGVIVLLSDGWKKGIFFDFKPLRPPFENRDFKIEKALGDCYSQLTCAHLRDISETEWEGFLAEGWFPFIALKRETILEMRTCVTVQDKLDLRLEDIAKDFDNVLEKRKGSWKRNRLMAGHIAIIERACERYLEGDYICSAHLIYNRLEGIMREIHTANKHTSNPKHQTSLTNAVTDKMIEDSGHSLLLPDRFKKFLNEVYFANFDPSDPKGISRNTVSHGVAPVGDFDKKTVLVGLLTLDQLLYYAQN